VKFPYIGAGATLAIAITVGTLAGVTRLSTVEARVQVLEVSEKIDKLELRQDISASENRIRDDIHQLRTDVRSINELLMRK